ncbi:hypothetical protein BDL97_11G102200 [Sphagnum fallax]|nr:hypothetical protein BDL97_11G102200 [Sphagnum fallax]
MAHCDEFVMSALISHGKMEVLMHELLVVELWKEKVFPHIIKQLAAEASTITLQLILYQETTIVNLLEVILFHREACEAIGSDCLLELTDYCYRKLVYLNTQASEDAAYKERTAAELLDMKPEEDLREKAANMQFAIAICSLTILRYLTDYMSDLPLSVMARMLDSHDVIMALVPLVEDPPWQRKCMRSNKIVMEKYVEGKWTQVQPQDRFKLNKPDAQLWLALYNLIVDTRCRIKYTYDSFRRDQVLKVAPSNAETKAGRLIIEQVPELREKLASHKNWKKIAHMQLETVFSREMDPTAQQQQAQELLQMFQFGEMMEQPTCAVCGKVAMQRCSRCKTEWYCGRDCQVSVWKTHKKACDILTGNLEK